MTARIPGLDQPVPQGLKQEGHASGLPDVRLGQGPIPVTRAMIDEAVDQAIQQADLPVDRAAVFKFNIAKDYAGPIAQAFHASEAEVRSRRAGIARDELVIKYALTDDEVAALVDYAPEYKLRFNRLDSHDHAAAAACRLIDHRIIKSRLPKSLQVTDVGGNPIVHIQAGASNVHVCGPTVDVKDPNRHVLRRMRAGRIRDTSTDLNVVSAAKAYLEGQDHMVCGRRAQECGHAAKVITAIHVYDIPLNEWPQIMENKGAVVLEGCLLFSDKFFEEKFGELGVSKARYEIDVKRDQFRMGFSNSPSWWYSHSWSEYAQYGCDQILSSKTCTYSYKVIERRGDTLFFRMLKLGSGYELQQQVVARSSVTIPLVKVDGFELSEDYAPFSPALRKKTYWFPRNLWYEMVTQASEDFERGVMDFTKMYNHYRTVSVKQTINAVVVMGGDPVSSQELVPLVVHACLAAVAQSMLGQRTTRGMTEAVMRGRQLSSEGFLNKFASALFALTSMIMLSPLYPFRSLATILKSKSAEQLEQWVLDWEPVERVVAVPMHSIQTAIRENVEISDPISVMRSEYKASAAFDHMALVLADPELRGHFTDLCPHVSVPEPEARAAENQQFNSKQVSEAPSYETGDDIDSLQEVRRAAIAEHIVEIKMHNDATASVCRRAYAELCVHSTPKMKALITRSELYRNPDLWWVNNGVIQYSTLGLKGEDFSHMAVYHPRPDSDTGDPIRAVHKTQWKSVKDDMLQVHDNFIIADSSFCGWVLTTDDLAVYNGVEVMAAMEQAQHLPHKYKITLHKAPPGSGKTYKIVHSAKPDKTDAVMCPVRESIEDTRGQIVGKFPDFPVPRKLIRTVDSYLVNHGVDEATKALTVTRLLADECFMAHAGKWYAAAALLGVEQILAYGDDEQIPHIPRVQAPKLHVKLKAQGEVVEWLTRRCPPSAVAAWGSVYSWKVRSISKQIEAKMEEVRSTKGREVPEECLIMCMYQADKIKLRQMYAHVLAKVKIKSLKDVITAHESEGKTFKHVWLHRFDNRKRSDKFSLFDQQPHVLVAMSRHTHSFLYSCPGELGDLVSQWIKRSKDPRRVAAAQDVESAGTSIEKI